MYRAFPDGLPCIPTCLKKPWEYTYSHVFPRIPMYSHWYSQGLYIDLKKPLFSNSLSYISQVFPLGIHVCCRRLCWADGIPMGIRGNTVCCRPSGNALAESPKNERCTVILNTGFSALSKKKNFSLFLKDFFYALIPLVKLLPFLPSKQEKKESLEGHTVRI